MTRWISAVKLSNPTEGASRWMSGAAPLAHERRVPREPEVDEAAPRREGLGDEGLDEGEVVVDRVHLPDDVVPEAEPLEHAVEGRQAGPGRRGPGRAHGDSVPSSATSNGDTRHTSRPYSAIARSEENFPERAVFRIDMRVQRSRSAQAASTARCASR